MVASNQSEMQKFRLCTVVLLSHKQPLLYFLSLLIISSLADEDILPRLGSFDSRSQGRRLVVYFGAGTSHNPILGGRRAKKIKKQKCEVLSPQTGECDYIFVVIVPDCILADVFAYAKNKAFSNELS